MKKSLISIFFLVFAGCLFAAASETSVYDEVCAAYDSGYFPGVVEKSAIFEKNYPDSIYDVNVRLMQGEALIKMFRYNEAIEKLIPAEKKLTEYSLENAHCNYLCGLAYYYLKDYDNSLIKFYKACDVSKFLEREDFYTPSVLYAGRIYYIQLKYEKAEPLFSYVVQNGSFYNKIDYDEAFQKLIYSYNQQEKFKNTINLFEKVSKDNFAEEVYFTICMYSAEAYENVDENIKAYELYSSIVESGIKNLAVLAMKKAYILATEKNIADPAEIFSKTAQNFSDFPELVCDFWIRLGIDDFNKGNLEKSIEYFDESEKIILENEKDWQSQKALISLYKAKVFIQNNQLTEAKTVLSSITDLENLDLLVKDYWDSYYSELLNVTILLKEYSLVDEVFAKIKNPSVGIYYLYAGCFYDSGDFNKVCEILKNQCEVVPSLDNLKLFELYASAVSKTNTDKTVEIAAKACSVYKKLYEASLLNSESCFEYAKNLFICKNYNGALEIAKNTQNIQKDYFFGLCFNNLKKWEIARDYFINYIKAQSNSQEFNLKAYYYKGYTEYMLGDWKNAYVSFVRYGTDAGDRKAYEYAAKSALQSGDYKNAAVQAENVIKKSKNLAEKQEALLFCVEIYSNILNFEKAVNLLLPYVAVRNDFARECLYQIAKLYEKMNLVSKADETYTKLITEYSDSPLAEESMFNIGQLYYSKNDFSTAQGKFNSYIYKYPKGKFLDSALFFCADSNLKLGNMQKSISYNNILVSDYLDSIYLYGAYKNLLTAYYAVEDYSNALKIARNIVAKYPSQAAKDEIGRKVVELQRILGGTNKEVSEKISEYEKLGKATTKAGRFAGSELVKYYAADGALQKEAYEIANEVLAKQTESDEIYTAAQNAEFIADYERKNNEGKKAAEMYLKSASLYRKSGEASEKEVASVLYSAVEAFRSAEMLADAQETADLIGRLYPSSTYANRAKALLN